MAWPTSRIESWESFAAYAAGFRTGDPFGAASLMRGQADASLPLTSSLNRLLPKGMSIEAALEIETNLLSEFQSHVRNHLRKSLLPRRDATLDWWALMQHYGAPTRLIDWSASPYVAAYFAVVSHWDRDGALWKIHPWTLGDAVKKAIGGKTLLNPVVTKSDAPSVTSPYWTRRKTERVIAQQGHFTVSLNLLSDQETNIDAVLSAATSERGEGLYEKLVVPKELKPQFLDQLRGMNVTANALFPGIDGLGRSINELAQIACRSWPYAT